VQVKIRGAWAPYIQVYQYGFGREVVTVRAELLRCQPVNFDDLFCSLLALLHLSLQTLHRRHAVGAGAAATPLKWAWQGKARGPLTRGTWCLGTVRTALGPALGPLVVIMNEGLCSLV
jgi:hypothetical protein